MYWQYWSCFIRLFRIKNNSTRFDITHHAEKQLARLRTVTHNKSTDDADVSDDRRPTQSKDICV